MITWGGSGGPTAAGGACCGQGHERHTARAVAAGAADGASSERESPGLKPPCRNSQRVVAERHRLPRRDWQGSASKPAAASAAADVASPLLASRDDSAGRRHQGSANVTLAPRRPLVTWPVCSVSRAVALKPSDRSAPPRCAAPQSGRRSTAAARSPPIRSAHVGQRKHSAPVGGARRRPGHALGAPHLEQPPNSRCDQAQLNRPAWPCSRRSTSNNHWPAVLLAREAQPARPRQGSCPQQSHERRARPKRARRAQAAAPLAGRLSPPSSRGQGAPTC